MWYCFRCGEKLREIGLGLLLCERCGCQFFPSMAENGQQVMTGDGDTEEEENGQ